MTIFDDIYYVKRVQAGDANAFAYIVRRYERMILTVVNKIVSNRHDAEDIAQEVFIKVYRSLDKFRHESEFSTWLYRIAYNTSLSEIRKRKYETMPAEDYLLNVAEDDISDVKHETTVEEQLKYLDIVLRKLKPDDAMLITLFYLNHHSVEQIAEITSLTQANVKVKLHRIRKAMNVEMNKLIAI